MAGSGDCTLLVLLTLITIYHMIADASYMYLLFDKYRTYQNGQK